MRVLLLLLGVVLCFVGLAVTTAPQQQEIVAFLLPHSHDDVGWLYTIDQYYNMSVQHIYSTVVQELYADSEKRFISVEMAYFYMWWTQTATPTQQQQARTIIQNKQLEFVSAGWVMQDEACSTFSAGVDQMTEGHQFILQEFGALPNAGWQIDPFGATGATASMFALMGFQSHVVDRINYTLTDTMEATKSLEFLWNGVTDLGTEGQILTHALSEVYCEPMGYGFDFEATNTTKNPPITPANVENRAQAMVDIIKQRSAYYLTNNVLIPWGCDFKFVNATAQFSNMQQIVDYINANSSYGVSIRYSTLREYFDTILAAGVNWPERSGGDFGTMPCSANNSAYTYWTGYYTSRNLLKGLIRQAESQLKSADAIYVQASLDAGMSLNFTQVQTLRRALAESQHHDGVSDLYTGEEQAAAVAQKGLGALLSTKTPLPLTNVSTAIQNIAKGEYLIRNFYGKNTLAWTHYEFVQVGVWRTDLMVTDVEGNIVNYQINPAFQSAAPYNLIFETSIPPMGYSTYLVSIAAQVDPSRIGKLVNATTAFTISNSIFTLTWNSNLTLSHVNNSWSKVSAYINQQYMEYDSQTQGAYQNSGAYVFAPAGPANPLPPPTITQIVSGPFVNEVYQSFGYISHTVRLYTGHYDVENFIEINSTVGVLPPNKEVIVRYSTDLNNYAFNPYNQQKVLVHYTDENGYTTVPRYTDFTIVDTIGGNYFPMVMRGELHDQTARNTQFGVVSDRTHGTASLAQGQLEVMLHRRILSDDHQGLNGYPLNDTDVVYPLTRLLLGGNNDPFGFFMKRQAMHVNFPAQLFYGPASTTPPGTGWTSLYNTQYTPMKTLPANVHLMSFKTIDGSNNVIMRFQHLCSSKDELCTGQVSFDLSEYFTTWSIAAIKETTLSANQVINDNGSTTITLNNMEIKTFIVTLTA